VDIGTDRLDEGVRNMKKLLLLVPMLAWSGVAVAQQSEAEADQCTPATLPVIERVDIGPASEQPSETSTVLQVDISAGLPGGGSLNYDFRAQDGAISGSGSTGTWTVVGNGSFNATVEVSSPGTACTAFAYLTYTAAEGEASDGE
jgi:hypothetical protein